MPSLDVTNTTMPLLFGYSHELLNINSLLFSESAFADL